MCELHLINHRKLQNFFPYNESIIVQKTSLFSNSLLRKINIKTGITSGISLREIFHKKDLHHLFLKYSSRYTKCN